MGKLILDLDASETTLTDVGDINVATQKVGQTIAKKTTLLKIRSLFKSYFDTIYGFVRNTATGAFDATLNQTSGLLTYTGTMNTGSVTQYTLTNSLITATTVLGDLFIQYDTGLAGEPEILCYTVSSGSAVFSIKNTGGDSITSFNLSFRILNP